MMYRRRTALGVGGYDPGFAPVWFDDLDITLAIRRQGHKVFFLPDVRVVHHLGKRDPLTPTPGRVVRGLGRRAAGLLPKRARLSAAQALRLDLPPPEHRERLSHHYAYWRAKWGFDLLNPDMDAVRERWGETEICWRTSPEMRAEGERIVAAYEAT
jgi:hypothetical protein